LYVLQQLIVDVTVPKKLSKIIDCTYIREELINKYGVNPLIFLIVYALSGCDTCSFVRNVSKRTFMQMLFDNLNDFADLEKLVLLPTNKNDVSIVRKKINLYVFLIQYLNNIFIHQQIKLINAFSI